MGILLAALAVGTILGLIRLTSPAVRALTYRKGAGWYLAPNLQLEPSGLPQDRKPARNEHMPVSTIRWWLVGGTVLVVLDVVAWVTGYPVLGILIAPFGLLLIAGALHGWRLNRWLDHAGEWSTGHRHDIPPVR